MATARHPRIVVAPQQGGKVASRFRHHRRLPRQSLIDRINGSFGQID
jgi:hypothetical protein